MKFISVAVISALAASVSATTQCAKSQFYHNTGKTGECCLPSGGTPNPPSCPSDKECPGSYQWHGAFECCVPTIPSAPVTPSCPSGPWDHNEQCCHKPTPPSPPTPSKHAGGGYRKRSDAAVAKLSSRNWRSKTLSCPAGETICNVSTGSSQSSTYACVNTMKDVNFCGGCGADEGMDCSTIANAWNTACDMGECAVLTCEPGYRVSHNGRKCIAMD